MSKNQKEVTCQNREVLPFNGLPIARGRHYFTQGIRLLGITA
ncbi:hypothetical protein [Aliikangiella sp. IMCC44359]